MPKTVKETVKETVKKVKDEKKAEINEIKLEDAQQKPLYQLMEKLLDEDEHIDKALISYDNLTAILKTDFDVDMAGFTEPEVDSYINVFKWSLKVWPGWDGVITEDKETSTNVVNKEKLLDGYVSVKKFINYRLRITRRCITAIEQDINTESDSEDMVLRVECGKNQLKTLINSRISRKLKLINNNIPKQIEEPNRFQWMSFMDIFNWPFLEVHVELPNFSYTHKNISKSQYRVVDLKASYNDEVEKNDKELYSKHTSGKKFGMEIKFFLEYLEQVMKYMSDGRRVSGNKKIDLTGLFQEIIKDVSVLKHHITIETVYKHNLSEYNFTQYLSNLVKASAIEDDDLYKKFKNVQPRLQHTITPAIEFCLNKFSCTYTTDEKGQRYFKLGLEAIERTNNNWLKIHCSLCDVDITGFTSFNELNTHLAKYHGAENEFQCVKCKNFYNVLQLAYRRWHHNCS